MTIIKFSTSDNAIRAFWLVHWISVISHYTIIKWMRSLWLVTQLWFIGAGKLMEISRVFWRRIRLRFTNSSSEEFVNPGGIKFSKPIYGRSKEELNVCLKCFYTSAQKKDGTYYKSSSTKSVRATIDHFLRTPPHNKLFSTISDQANKLFEHL